MPGVQYRTGPFYWLSTCPLTYPQYRDTTRVDEKPRGVYTYNIQTNNNFYRKHMLYTPTTTDIDKMNRTDLVFEVAKKAHIDHYQQIIRWPTEMIRTLMHWYTNKNNEEDAIVKRFSRNEIDTITAIRRRMYLQGIIGIDMGTGESQTFTHIFRIK